MATAKEISLAKKAFDAICSVFDDNNWKYEKDTQNLKLGIGMNGEDIPMYFEITCDADRQLVIIMSQLPFKMSEDTRIEGALATSYINYQLSEGSFDYNVLEGDIYFRITASFRESLVSKSLLDYLLNLAIFMVDKFNDKLLALSKGTVTLEDFINQFNA